MPLLPWGGKITHSEPIDILHEQEGLVIRRNPKNRWYVATLHHTADPSKRDPKWREEAKAVSQSEAKFRQEYDMDYTAMFGERVFPQLDSHKDQLILRPEYPKIDESYLYAGMDWGVRNPSSFIVFGLSKNEMGEPCYDAVWEYYDVPVDMPSFVQAITACPYFDKIRFIASDPSIWQNRSVGSHGRFMSIADHMVEFGLSKIVPAGNNREEAWLTLMKQYWASFEERGPLFRIRNTCPNLIREMRNATFAELTNKQLQTRNQAEKMLDKNNHAMDAVKYFMLTAPELVAVDDEDEVVTDLPAHKYPAYAKYVRKRHLPKIKRRRIL